MGSITCQLGHKSSKRVQTGKPLKIALRICALWVTPIQHSNLLDREHAKLEAVPLEITGIAGHRPLRLLEDPKKLEPGLLGHLHRSCVFARDPYDHLTQLRGTSQIGAHEIERTLSNPSPSPVRKNTIRNIHLTRLKTVCEVSFDAPDQLVRCAIEDAKSAAGSVSPPLFLARGDVASDGLKRASPSAKPPGHLVVLSSQVVKSILRIQWPQEDHTVRQIGRHKTEYRKELRFDLPNAGL